ncbi:hypothetical protein XENOCAPTIV_029723 [Xenoophorus captivus]|uniref:Uncharacterized protein n=1 Tax=Xenoophorus captivus TaxID=1517983 RepID=A0ABV0RE90_9TELE
MMNRYGFGGVELVKRVLDHGPVEVSNMSDINKASPHGCDNGALTDRFGVLIQAQLAVVAFSTLMREYFLSFRLSSLWMNRLEQRLLQEWPLTSELPASREINRGLMLVCVVLQSKHLLIFTAALMFSCVQSSSATSRMPDGRLIQMKMGDSGNTGRNILLKSAFV